MKKIIFIFAFVLSNVVLADSVVCPLGNKEDHLTIHRVMRNFGRFMNPADLLALKSEKDSESITDTEIQNAASKLQIVESCLQAVLDNPTGEMLPDKVSEMSEEEKQKYVPLFLKLMNDFKVEVITFRSQLEQILSVEKASRNFKPYYSQYELINRMVDDAHQELGGG